MVLDLSIQLSEILVPSMDDPNMDMELGLIGNFYALDFILEWMV